MAFPSNSFRIRVKIPNPNPNKDKDAVHSNNHASYMLTPICFKLICMQSTSKKAHEIRQYFIEVNKAFIRYRSQTLLSDGVRVSKAAASNVLNKKK